MSTSNSGTLRVFAVAAAMVAALGIGMLVGSPDTAAAQDDATTQVPEDTGTTEAPDTTSEVPESTDEPRERPDRGGHPCDDRAGDDSTGDGSTDGDTSSSEGTATDL